MFLEERIDILKHNFSPEDFKVPFKEGSNILKSIEKEFIITKDLTKDLNNLRQRFNNLGNNIKNKIEIKSVDLNNHYNWLEKLNSSTNYWTIIANNNSPSLKHFVYDCKPKALIALYSITQDDFFVVDKKYKWFSYFQVNKQQHQATIFKSGEKITPFES